MPAPGIGMALPAALAQDPVFGGVPEGKPAGTAISLSLADAIARGLKHNLAGVLGEEGVRAAEASRRRLQSLLLPNLSAGITESQLQVNLAALGFRGFPGVPMVVGPFSVFDIRLYLSQVVFDLTAINQLRAGDERTKAAESTYRSMRDRVVLVCGDLYLQAVTGKSRIDAARAQLQTARVLYDLAVDRKQAGVVPGIEVLRARVEFQAQQQRLILAENDFATAKLTLARAIGLPLGQEFNLADEVPYATLAILAPGDALQRAYRDRPDLQSAMARLRAAELSRKAARAERLPSLRVNANYGVNGPAPGQSHGSFSVVAGIKIPIFEGGQAEAKIQEADSVLRQQQAEIEDLRARIYYEVQTAFLNMKAADERVQVASSSVKLAQDQLAQAQDRFGAGVASNIEVVQAQEALANASEAHISSLYAHNTAKGRLAHVLGAAESLFLQFLRGNP